MGLVVLAEEYDTINLRVPASAAYTQMVRLAAFTVASRMDFDINKIEDLRVAVDEASNYAILNSSADDQINIAIHAKSDCLEILITFTKATESVAINTELGVFSRMILEALLDEFDLLKEGDFFKILLRKNCEKVVAD